jgi:hypothetical protein
MRGENKEITSRVYTVILKHKENVIHMAWRQAKNNTEAYFY